jgi:hypothetical protein
MQHVVAQQPAIAYAVHCVSLYDQLDLTLELLRQDEWPDFDEPEPLPPNVVRFRPPRSALTPPASVHMSSFLGSSVWLIANGARE